MVHPVHLLALPVIYWRREGEAYEGIEPSRGGVYAVKDGNDERRIVCFESAVETYDLEDGGAGEEYEREDGSRMTDLVPRILMRKRPRDEFHTVN